MYLLVLFIPFLLFILSGCFGRYFGRKIIIKYVLILNLILLIISSIIFYEVCLSNMVVTLNLYNWCTTNNSIISIGFFFDSLSSIMILIIVFISSLVQIYSLEYMNQDPHLNRFMSYLALFTFFMLMLVLSDNFLQLFIGWEGVGFCSYLLINFWFTRILANKASLKAMIINRISDVFFILGILLIYLYFNSLDYKLIFDLIPLFVNKKLTFLWFDVNFITLIAFFLFIGAIGKSAQIGFHTWLPDAMEGPTPVSSLLHAATMVTAGIFLIVRCSPIFEYAPFVLFLISIFGALTAFFGAITGFFSIWYKKSYSIFYL